MRNNKMTSKDLTTHIEDIKKSLKLPCIKNNIFLISKPLFRIQIKSPRKTTVAGPVI